MNKHELHVDPIMDYNNRNNDFIIARMANS